MIDCPSAYVADGDTLRCGPERLRLLGIDAPEIERCPQWRACAPGDGQAARQSLIAALRFGPIRYRSLTVDRYGRTVAVVWAGPVNLSCWQLQQRQAIYKRNWDNGGIIGRECRVSRQAKHTNGATNPGGRIRAVPAAAITKSRMIRRTGYGLARLRAKGKVTSERVHHSAPLE
jgi:hypothetical protein